MKMKVINIIYCGFYYGGGLLPIDILSEKGGIDREFGQ